MPELHRRDFLRLSLGAVLLPTIPNFAYEAESPYKIVIQYYEDSNKLLTKAFSLTYAQMFESEPTEPLTMTAVQACVVTSVRAEFLIDGYTKSCDLLWLLSLTGKTWPMQTGESITLMPA